VHGATDAAKSAGDIVLTRDGLSPIYTAIQISRRIFKRLKSYVIYRICITVQVVFFLACLALVFNVRFRALYIILLALFHDLQIVTIAYDHQVAGAKPETPSVMGLLGQSWTMGFLMFVETILLVGVGDQFMSEEFKKSAEETRRRGTEKGLEMDKYQETCLFLQISNSSAILILSARTVGFFFTTMPAWQLLLSTAIGQVLINLWVLNPIGGLVAQLNSSDVIYIWVYDLCWLLALDLVKMGTGALWEKFKPADIDKNPALVHAETQARNSRRASNRLGAAHVKAAANPDGGGEMKKRISQRVSQRNA